MPSDSCLRSGTAVVFAACLASCIPPSGSFPGSVSQTDGKGVTTWWGCMKLPSGDVREVGSYRDRALFFMPGGKCDRDPQLPDTTDTIFVTWREAKADSDDPFGVVHLIVSGDCPGTIPPSARDAAARLIQEYLDDPSGPARYRSDAEHAYAAVKELSGPTTRLPRTSFASGLFYGGVWGPVRRPGTYPICVPVTSDQPSAASPPP